MALFIVILVIAVSSPAGAAPPSGPAKPAAATDVSVDIFTIAVAGTPSMQQTRPGAVSQPQMLAERAWVRAQLVNGTILDQPTPRTAEAELALARRSHITQSIASSVANQQVRASRLAKDYAGARECIQKAPANNVAGWYKNHWAWCQSFDLVIRTYRKGVPLGRLTFRVTQVGRGYQGQRQVEVDEWASQVNYSGVWPYGLPIIVVKMTCSGSPHPQQCRVSGSGANVLTEGQTEKLGGFVLNSSASGARGTAKIGTAIFHPTFTVSSGLLGTESGFAQAFRCDSAAYLPSTGACIFHRLRGTFYLSRKDAAVSQAAKHIWDAQHAGLPSVLSRLVDKRAQERNTRVAKAACKKRSPTKPTGKDCDEYPFKSSRQGAALAQGKFSVRYIKKEHNQLAGSRLGVWYGQDRILDGDRFQVTIR